MRIVAFSDAHIDINSRPKPSDEEKNFLECLIEVLQNTKPDILICAGDLTPDTQLLEKALRAIVQEVNAQHHFFVPGNHDIWFRSSVDPSSDASSSLDKHERVLPQVCKDTGFHFLPGCPKIINGLGFLGSVGWYDYSYRNSLWNKQIIPLYYAAKRWRGIVWNDVNYAEWEMADPEVCKWMIQTLENDYQQLEEKGMDECLLTLHHIPFRKFVIYKNTPNWDFCSAFMGSQQFGDWALSHKKISTTIFGHTHTPQEGQIETIYAYCNPIGYLWETKGITDLSTFLQTRVIIKDITG